MVWVLAYATSLLLACQLSSCVRGDVIQNFRRGSIGDGSMRAYADAVVEDRVLRRQSYSTKLLNSTAWETQTTAACASSLMTLNGVASNAAGMAVCYNIPFLDNSTGLFQADLRLYMISNATGEFNGIPPENVTVGLQYSGASVQTINPSELHTRSFSGEFGLARRAAMTPSLIQAYAFVGQINKNMLMPNMNSSMLESLLIPVVTLSAVNSSGTKVNATLSSTEAAFVTGVFADKSQSTAAASTASSSTASPTPFVLPGTHILIFPVGAIITGVWAFLGIVTVAYGTIGRMNFREHYRRQKSRQEKGAMARI